MDELAVDLTGPADLELREVTVGVADGVIAFEVEGVIHGLDEETLAAVRDRTLEPSEVRFTLTSN